MKNFIKLRLASFLLFAALGGNLIAFGQTRQLERQNAVNQTSEKRTALVIGNGGYAESPLRNPVNDAGDMAATLKTLGFEVLAYANLDQNAMKKAIRDFGAKLRAKGGVGLFYYAGHGVQVRGANYLIPIGAKVDSEQEVEYEAVEAGLVLAQMEDAANAANIVILDACRNNPFARSYRSAEKGLASINAPSGTLIAYATAPGSVASDGAGRNGLYTQELLKQLKTENLSVEEAFKRVRVAVRGLTANRQTPWESSSLVGNFYFKGSGDGAAPPAAAAVDQAAAEAALWDAIKDSNEAANFIEFIKSFPRGRYLAQAKLRLKKLQKQPAGQNSIAQNPFEALAKNKKPANSRNAINIYMVQANSYGGEEITMFVGVQGMNPAADVKVFSNASEITSRVKDQNAYLTSEGYYGSVLLAGGAEDLNLKVGLNEVYVTVDGVKAAPFTFKQLESQMPKSKTADSDKGAEQPTRAVKTVKIERVAANSVPDGAAFKGGSGLYVYLKENMSATAKVKVFLNGADVTALLDWRGSNSWTIKVAGDLNQLSFLDGRNEVYVVIDGVQSEPYAFNF